MNQSDPNTDRRTEAPEDSAEAAVDGAQPPWADDSLQARPRLKTAAGLTAVFESTRFALREMGAARTLQTLSKVNQKDGFDCPSCAWPDPDGHRSMAEFCENGARAVAAEATRARVTPEFFAAHSIDDLKSRADMWLERAGRITHPMILRAGASHYEPISWDSAFEFIAGELNALASPDEALFYTSGRASNEAAFLYQLFVRQFGTNNLPDCSNMCHESSGLGLNQTIGIGKTTVKLEDFLQADSIFVIGQNPGTCHPRMLSWLAQAARNGCKIVSINPLAETGLIRFKHPQEILHILGPGTPIASLFVPVRINGDVALLKGIMKEMLEEDDRAGGQILANQFIDQQTEGFREFADDLRLESWEIILENSGVSRELIHQAAEIAMKSGRMICCWAMGITQHKNGVANVQSIVNFALMRGQIGRPGAGLCAVRGHSNVQGDRTMGIFEKMPDRFLDALGSEFHFQPPRKHGLDTVGGIQAMHRGDAKILFALGGNLLSAGPDTNYLAEALQKCRLTVQVSTKLNRGHLITGRNAIILPCLGRTERDVQKSGEQFVTVEDTMGVVHGSRGTLDPASPHLLSEVAIVCRLARATFRDAAEIAPNNSPPPFSSVDARGKAAASRPARSSADWENLSANYDNIRAHIQHVIPGFHDFNARVRQPGGFYLPNGPRDGKFTTPTGRAKFTMHPIPRHDLAPGQLLLTTLRSHDQFNTTIYGEDDRYRGIHGGRHVVFLNEADIRELGLRDGQWVDIVSHHDGQQRRGKRFRVVKYEIPPKCAAAYFPEANVLVPVRHAADGSNQPASKSLVITLEKIEE